MAGWGHLGLYRCLELLEAQDQLSRFQDWANSLPWTSAQNVGEDNVLELRKRLGATIIPIQAEFFRSNFIHHEDQQYANWILQVLYEGFRVGFHCSGVVLRKLPDYNMLSAIAYIQRNCRLTE